MPLTFSAGRLVLVAGLICLSLAACGRRGALEAPPGPAVAKPEARPTSRKVERTAVSSDPNVATLEAEEDEDPAEAAAEAIVPSPSPKPAKRSRNYTIPKDPFILDPLL